MCFIPISYNSDIPSPAVINNSATCAKFSQFVSDTIKWVSAGFIVAWGPDDLVASPYLVLPLNVEPTKPWLCHNERYLNLWIRDLPFKLDHLRDLLRLCPSPPLPDNFRQQEWLSAQAVAFLIAHLFWLSVARFLIHLLYSSIRLESQCIHLSQAQPRGFGCCWVHWGSSVTIHWLLACGSDFYGSTSDDSGSIFPAGPGNSLCHVLLAQVTVHSFDLAVFSQFCVWLGASSFSHPPRKKNQVRHISLKTLQRFSGKVISFKSGSSLYRVLQTNRQHRNVKLGYIQVIGENLTSITSPVTRLSFLDVQNTTFFRSVQQSCFPHGQYNWYLELNHYLYHSLFKGSFVSVFLTFLFLPQVCKVFGKGTRQIPSPKNI